VDLGGLIVRVLEIRSAIPLFDRMRHHSSVPTNNRAAVARSGGPGRPKGRREAALPWTGASTTACLRSFGRSIRVIVPLFFVLTVCDLSAAAETESAAHTASSRTNGPFADSIDDASRRFGVPVQWIRSVLGAESAGDVRARSPKGAMGLMQIMPDAWTDLRLRYGLGNDPYDARDNILAGTAYLRELHDRFGSPDFIAAYNSGPTRYEEHLAGRPLPAESQAYLEKLAPMIGSNIAGLRAVAKLRSSATSLFVVRSDRSIAADQVQLERLPKRVPPATPIHDISAIVPHATGLFVARSNAGASQ
jgi:soluble lytic murein transglycosylase-like protein